MDDHEAAEDEASHPSPLRLGLYDAHCHPTDIMSSLEAIPRMQARVLTIMATRIQDQDLVMQANQRFGLVSADGLSDTNCSDGRCQVIPAFGWHPWFSHQLCDDTKQDVLIVPNKKAHYQAVITPCPEDEAFLAELPEPRSLSMHLERTKQLLVQCPFAMVGEIGLDRSFRIPESYDRTTSQDTEQGLTPGSRDGRKLSPYRVDIKHQQTILKAQLKLAGEMSRAVSVHGVAAHGLLYETLRSTWKGHERKSGSKRNRKKDRAFTEDMKSVDEDAVRGASPYPPRICLHSYSGPPDTLKQYLHPSVPSTIFFSFSKAINFSTAASEKATKVIKALPADRILIESDLHRAGPEMDRMLEDMAQIICRARNWDVEYGVRQLAENWRHFAFGEE